MRAEETRGQGSRKATRVVLLVAKAMVTIGLITWLLSSDTLDLSSLKVLISSPQVILITALAWLVVPVFLSTARWRVLLGIVGVEVPLMRATALQTMALFFNGLVPGNVGGDLLKNHALLGNQGGRLLVLVLAERAIGLVALIWTAALGIFLSWDLVLAKSELGVLASGLGLLILGSILGPAALLYLLPESLASQGPASDSGRLSRVAAFIRRGVAATLESLNLLRRAPFQVLKAFAISFLIHLGGMAYFLFLSRQLGNPDATAGQIAMIFPPGIISVVLPISISGLGVGHVMFSELFRVVGLTRGADVFNAYLVGMLAPCVLGAIPYVFLRGKMRGTNEPKAGDA